MQEQEQRQVCYDSDLEIEAYHLSGIIQKFPNHFHEYYVIGFIEGGGRRLWCRDQEYDLRPGDLVLFNPHDNHHCGPVNGEALDYRAVNISTEVMRRAAADITGKSVLPYFSQTVVFQSDISESLAALYLSITKQAPRLEKEEAFFFLLEQVICECSKPADESTQRKPDDKVSMLCAYLEDHYAENVTLNQLTDIAGLSRSYLLHRFALQTGVSPYRYLQSLRIERAKKLLEQGCPPIDAASLSGFSDQSHFTRFFKDFIGLTPKQYQRIFRTGSRDCGL